jgi:hypothetical protein
MTGSPYGWLNRWQVAAAAAESADHLRSRLADQSAGGAGLRRSDRALLGDLHWPRRHHDLLKAKDPGSDVALLTVANARFFRGLEALLLSLLDHYPDLSAPILILHDGSLGDFLQRRLTDIYARLLFEQPSPPWAAVLPRTSLNQRRIGVLGYLNSHALSLRGFRRVLVLDADLLITGALDPLWADTQDFQAIADCGDRPWAAVSSRTARPVVNSGVLSIPGWALTDSFACRMEELIRHSSDPACPLLDCFADQKVWNLFLADQPLQLLPLNYNCNVKYLVRYLGGCAEGLSVVHFAGPKPWLTWPWVSPDPADEKPGAVTDHLLWNRHYRQLLLSWRISLFRRLQSEPLSLPPGTAYLATDPSGFPVSGIPFGQSKHLLLADPDVFGSDWPDLPHWPDGWLAAIAAATPLLVWAPFEWEPALRHLPLPDGVSWRWLLIEAPFSPALAQGDDLIAAECPWDAGFEPWSDPPLVAVERAVRRQLLAMGAEPLKVTGECPP